MLKSGTTASNSAADIRLFLVFPFPLPFSLIALLSYSYYSLRSNKQKNGNPFPLNHFKLKPYCSFAPWKISSILKIIKGVAPCK